MTVFGIVGEAVDTYMVQYLGSWYRQRGRKWSFLASSKIVPSRIGSQMPVVCLSLGLDQSNPLLAHVACSIHCSPVLARAASVDQLYMRPIDQTIYTYIHTYIHTYIAPVVLSYCSFIYSTTIQPYDHTTL